MIVYDKTRTTPNWAPGAADYLSTLLLPNNIVFEYGGGQSTRWLACRVPEGKVYTVEHDPVWIGRIRKLTAPFTNCRIIEARIDSELYVTAPQDLFSRPEVYIIDGYQRPKCLKFLMSIVQEDDIIVTDDALDYVDTEKILVGGDEEIAKFSMPHPYAGKKITRPRGNSVLTHHAATKETWIWRA